MKSSKAMLLSLLVLNLLSVAGCHQGITDSSILSESSEFKEQLLTDFKKGDSDTWSISDGWTNGGTFDVEWRKDNVSFDSSGMIITLNKEDDTYYGSEQRTNNFYQYGYFGIRMQAIKAVGTVSTFFTYTGPTDNGNPHDEIDIEILGKDPSKVQFNYFKDDKGSYEYMYDLGFDASESMHQYGFYWDSEQIIWYIDKKPVYKVTDSIPVTSQKIFQNVWKGTWGLNHWLGSVTDSDLPVMARYDNCTYADLEGKTSE